MVVAIAERLKIVVLDGGTRSGIMRMAGVARATSKANFPLIGVAVERLVSWTEEPTLEQRQKLDPFHTHFFLVPGTHWGDEAPWLSQIAADIAGQLPSLTILINGGNIARQDVALSLAIGRPVLIFRNTGRLADELAAQANERVGVHVINPIEGEQVLEKRIHSLLNLN